MLIRKSAVLASLIASFLGANSAEAGRFGKRSCCQSTPIVCPPCAPTTAYPQISTQAYTYGSPVMGGVISSDCGGCGSSYTTQVCAVEQTYTVSSQALMQGSVVASAASSDNPTEANILLTQLRLKLEGELDIIKQKLEKIQPEEKTSLDTVLEEVKKK